MPYSKGETPTTVKNLPPGAQALFKKCFNAVYREGQGEDKARMAGWKCVKDSYRKVSEGNWKSKS